MSSDYLSCKQAARLLDVSASTIKRLCDEHRLVSLRTPGGHRRITLKSVQECQSSAGLAEPGCWINKREANVALDYHEFAKRLLEFDEAQLNQLVNRYRQRYHVIELCDLVIAPAIVHLSAAQVRGELANHELTLAIQQLRRVLSELRRLQTPPVATAAVAVGAHIAGDPSDLASLMVELAMRELGWHATSLGSDIDAHTLGQAATSLNASIVWVCYVHHQPAEQLIQQNRMLRACMPTGARLVIGGGALSSQLRKSLSFNFFCDTLAQLREVLKMPSVATAA